MANEIRTERGTPLWSLNTFRSNVLSKLLDDLLARENEGLTQEQCARVKLALEKMIDAASGIPDGGFLRGTIWKELEKFAALYQKWNDIPGSDGKAARQRKQMLKKLRRQRHRLARRIRKNLYIISRELDLKLLGRVYDATGDLAQALPEIFKSLPKALKKYHSVMG